MLWWSSLIAIALAGTPRDADAIAAAGWSGDAQALLEGTYDADQLGLLARALGATGEPTVRDRLTLLGGLPDVQVRTEVALALSQVEGSAPAARRLLAQETTPSVRALLWRVLGMHGDGIDGQAAAMALTGRAREARAACRALETLARRGVALPGAGASLLGTLERPDPLLVEAAAAALAALPDGRWRDAAHERVLRAYERAPREATRVALLPIVVETFTDGAARRAWITAVLRGPFRAPKAELVRRGDLTPDEARPWVGDGDPWVAPQDVLLPALPDDLPTRLALALGADEAATRSAAAAAYLAAGGAGERLLDAADPGVRELAVQRGQLARDLRVAHLMEEPHPVVRRAAIQALPSMGEGEDEAALAAVRVHATSGQYGVQHAARAWLARRGEGLEAPVSARPGPPEEALDVDAGRVGVATIQSTAGTVRMRLDGSAAPVGVAAFGHHAAAGGYDGLAVYRVVPGRLVQSGDTRGDGLGGPSWWVPVEPAEEGFDAGSVGLLPAGDGLSSMHWFVAPVARHDLDGSASRIGEVVAGLDVVRRWTTEDRILSVRVDWVETR